MRTYRSRRAVLAATGGTALTATAGCLSRVLGGGSDNTITVFNAGSLGAAFETAITKFESEYDATVQQETAGSVKSTKKITEHGRKADVLGVSDFRLLRDELMPQYGNWYAIFATNAMAIAYTEQSKYADEFSTSNWYDVLARDDVVFAHSDPATDPNGYRSLMSMELGQIPFHGETLYGQDTYQTLISKDKVTASAESTLIGQLQAGSLDYAWEYKSAGASHDIQIIGLQPEVNLAKATSEYAAHYAKAKVQAGGKTRVGAPIAYGVTVPSVAENPGLGAKFVAFLLHGTGQAVVKNHGFTPVEPAVVPASDKASVPDVVRSHATAKNALGPLEL